MLVWIITGIVILTIGLVIFRFFNHSGKKVINKNQKTMELEIPEDVSIERFKCEDCGAQLTMDNIKMAAGAPNISCPYCDASYQLKRT